MSRPDPGSLFTNTAAEWENPEVVQIGRRPPRATSWPCLDRKPCERTYLYDIDDVRISLNGSWKLKWSPRPEERPVGFHEPGYDISEWDAFRVPGHFELNGYGKPVYSNKPYIFKCNPPSVTSEPPRDWYTYENRNPVGCLKRTFRIPEDWGAKEVIVYFGGVASAFYLWVNGRQIGYSQDSMSPAEFNITRALRPGENEIAVEVYTFCDGTYLEDQDFWRLSGIFRDVFLYAVNPVHLDDVALRAEPLPDGGGRLRAEVEITAEESAPAPGGPLEVEVSVYPRQGDARPLARSRAEVSAVEGARALCGVSVELEACEAWSPENPVLYPVVLVLWRGGELLDVRQFRTGFTSVRITDRTLCLNGVSIKLKGVNRHEHDPVAGRVMSRELMEKDMALMKAAHFNSVRTSHYPDHPLWYEICDQQGMTVMDEANVETHELSYHRRVLPGDREDWTAAVLDRVRSMVIRDRSHASVMLWSLGNEAGYGENFMKMREEIRSLDARPVQYADMNLAADLDSQTYPSPEWMLAYVAGMAERKGEQGQISKAAQHGEGPSNKPFVLNEYAHAMGNSGGDFHQYWEAIRAHDCLIGGYIWEWVDHGLRVDPNNPGAGYLYGGDFGDLPNDGNFCIDGLVGPDRDPNPHYLEIQHVQRPVALRVEPESGVCQIENRFFFSDLKAFSIRLTVRSGEKEEVCELDRPVAPGEVVSLPVKVRTDPQGEVMVNLEVFRPGENEPLCVDQVVLSPDGSRDQDWIDTVFPAPNPLWREETPSASPVRDESGSDIRIRSGSTCVKVSGTTGLICAIERDGIPLVDQPLVPEFWRVPTDNDFGNKHPTRCAVWKNLMASMRLEHLETEDTLVCAAFRHETESIALTLRYGVTADGSITLEAKLDADPGLPEMPRLGWRTGFTRPDAAVTWLGRGPHEAYADRKTSARVGRHTLPTAELATDYIHPQENGQRCDVRGLSVADLFSVTSDHLFSFTVHPYTQAALETATHAQNLVKTDRFTLYLDHAQMGVGGDNSWGMKPHPEFLIPSGRHAYTFRLQQSL